MRVDSVRMARILAGIGHSMVIGRPRSLLADCVEGVGCLHPRPTVAGVENVPEAGGLLLVANHWQRRGLWIGFVVAALTLAVGQRRPEAVPVHWLAVDRWVVDVRGRQRTLPLTRAVFRRVAANWGMFPVPTMRLDGTGGDRATERAKAVREAIRCAVAGDVVGVFPEGETGIAGPPGAALPGTGELAYLLGRRGVPTIAAAFRELGEHGRARIGPPFYPGRADPTGDLAAAIRREFDALGRDVAP